jgi:hypothetical protein
MSQDKTKQPARIIPIEEIPGYVEATQKEKRRRLLSFFDDGFTVCGFKVLPLTLQRCLVLELAGSPFLIQGAVVTDKDLENFLWAMSPEFGTDRRKRIKVPQALHKIFLRKETTNGDPDSVLGIL